jgi:hypothetical protein
MTNVQKAWQKAQDVWVKAGSPVPCYDIDYLQARVELAEAKRAAGQ